MLRRSGARGYGRPGNPSGPPPRLWQMKMPKPILNDLSPAMDSLLVPTTNPVWPAAGQQPIGPGVSIY